MKSVSDWLADFHCVNSRLLHILRQNAGQYTDEKLTSFEATLDLRQSMLEELEGYSLSEEDREAYERRREALADVEAEIRQLVHQMMQNLEAERATLQDQRMELGRLKKANRGYLAGGASAEGYFIDRKK